MQRFLMAIMVLAAAILVANPALAQDEGQFAVGANIGYYTLSGDDFETADPGFGLNGFGRYHWANGFSAGAGVAWNQYGLEGTDESVSVIGISVDPRYYFRLSNPIVRPFLGARASWMRQSGTIADSDMSSTGYAFGAAGGALFQVNPNLGIELTANFSALSFGDVDVDGTTVPDSESSGTGLSFTTGVVYGF